MLMHMLAPAQGSPRFDGDAVLLVIGLLVAGAVVLVTWASRPSVMARYSASPPPRDETPAGEAERGPSA